MKALFLDRDGVINKDSGYVYQKENFHFYDDIFPLCRSAISKNYLIFIITNQAGIGRGYYSIEDFEHLTNWMCKKFLSQNIVISKVYFSPFHPVHGLGEYKKDHETRKPRPGMILQAVKEFNINIEESVLIGNNFSDIMAGINAGIKNNIQFTQSHTKNEEFKEYYHHISSLCEADYFLTTN